MPVVSVRRLDSLENGCSLTAMVRGEGPTSSVSQSQKLGSNFFDAFQNRFWSWDGAGKYTFPDARLPQSEIWSLYELNNVHFIQDGGQLFNRGRYNTGKCIRHHFSILCGRRLFLSAS